MIEDGHANGRPAARVAGDILAWLAETEEEAEAAENEAPSAEEPGNSWIGAESHAVADALEADNRSEADPDETAANTATGETEASHSTPGAPNPANLRGAAGAVFDAWNDETNRAMDIVAALEGPMASLQTALAGRASRTTAAAARKPREGTKQELVRLSSTRSSSAGGSYRSRSKYQPRASLSASRMAVRLAGSTGGPHSPRMSR